MDRDRFKRRDISDWKTLPRTRATTLPAEPTAGTQIPVIQDTRPAPSPVHQIIHTPAAPVEVPEPDSVQQAATAAEAQTVQQNDDVVIDHRDDMALVEPSSPLMAVPIYEESVPLTDELTPARASRIPAIVTSHNVLTKGIVAGLLLLVISGSIYGFFLHNKPVSYGSAVIATSSSEDALHVFSPTGPQFVPLVPKSKPALATTGKGGGAYDAAHGTYGFLDKINGQTIAVSEQLLSQDSATAQSTVTDVTKTFTGVKQSIPVTSGTAYISTNVVANDQIVLYLSGQILIVIQSGNQHNLSDWSNYLNSLH
jgi:hypothetical protein